MSETTKQTLKFRAIIPERNATIFFTLAELFESKFSIREILSHWLIEGNIPDQFTGLKDKNGTEIYSGDIVQGVWINKDKFEESIFEVKDFGAGFSPFYQPTGLSSGFLYETSLFARDFEVIGNVIQDSNLLK